MAGTGRGYRPGSSAHEELLEIFERAQRATGLAVLTPKQKAQMRSRLQEMDADLLHDDWQAVTTHVQQLVLMLDEARSR
jgi:hypothetical protein